MPYDPYEPFDVGQWVELGGSAKLDGNWAVHGVLYHLAKLMRARCTVEIGIGRGHGTYTLGSHAKQVGGMHFAIDVTRNNCARAQRIVDHYNLPVTVVECDSKALYWVRKIDLCYVDGGHDFEQVLADATKYGSCIRRNGYIVFDDYGRKHCEVTEAVTAWLQGHEDEWDVQHWPWCWWMICRRR